MGRGYSCLLVLCVLLALLSSTVLQSALAQSLSDDTDALLLFKNSTDGSGLLDRISYVNRSVCTWDWIRCMNFSTNSSGSPSDFRVTKVLVSNMRLNGTLPPNSLGRLTELRMLNLSNNEFSGPLPSDLSKLNLMQLLVENSSLSGPFPNISTTGTARLTKLLLSGNKFSGRIPYLSALPNLLELDLSRNSFQGDFPFSDSGPSSTPSTDDSTSRRLISKLVSASPRLQIVNLAGNNLTGLIPDLSGLDNLIALFLGDNSFDGRIPSLPPNLSALDLRNNSLDGTIPPDLARKFPNAFEGNLDLCNPVTNSSCPAAAAPGPDPRPPTPPPSSSTFSIRNGILIAVGAAALIIFIFLFTLRYCSKRRKKAATKKSSEKVSDSSAVGAGLSSMGGDSSRSKLSFIDDSEQGYDLEDLLRASAEMLGKGSFGTAYKAVMESGMIVAVKRLRDVKDMRRNDFSHHMKVLGRLKHPNVVPLKAYYYAREEKLLIYEFMPNGSLFALLHGSRGPGRTPLEWPARLSIAQGVARGLTYLHQEFGYKFPHLNIKSSNVLMGKNFEVCISDCGLVPLMPSQIAAQRMAGYRAPEYSQGKKLTQKADVYTFGVLLLELLTGRQPAQSISDNGLDLPKWVQSMVREEWTGEVFDTELKSYLHGETEMVTLLQVAMSCVETKPEERPDMADVVEQLKSIRRGDSMIDTESYQSRSTEGNCSSFELPQQEGDLASR